MRGWMVCVVAVFIGILGGGCSKEDIKTAIEKKDLKSVLKIDKKTVHWGFTTQNFLSAVKVSVASSKQFIDYAAGKGLEWIELRDPDASLSMEECREISSYAAQKGIKITYSIQRGVLAPDFKEVFSRGLKNIVLFDGPKMARVLALRSNDPLGWSAEEFNTAVELTNWAAGLAQAEGLTLMIENADVIPEGDHQSCFGMSELLDAVDPSIEMQFDTANIFCGPQAVSPKGAERFLRKYVSRVTYMHLKSSMQMKSLPVIDSNPLDFKTILNILADKKNDLFVAIELASDSDDPEVIFQNMDTSLNVLRNNGLLVD